MNKKRLPLPPRVRAYLMSVPIEGLTIHLRLNGQFNTSLWTKLSFCFGGLITLFQLFHTPCKVRKLSSDQRNPKKGSFVHIPLPTTLSISHFHQSKSFNTSDLCVS